MKDIQKFGVQGSTGTVQGLIRKLTLTWLVAALALLVLGPLPARAAGAVTQLEFIQWLVQVTGDNSQFTATSGTADYLQWAQSKGLSPSGGWKPTATLTREVLAQALVQLLNLSATTKNGVDDYIRILAREGFSVPDAPEISRAQLVSFLSINLSARIPSGSPAKGNNGLGNGEDPPPPGWLNPRNPHTGNGQNDQPAQTGNPQNNPHNHP
jgi:hypothetical protein